MEDRTATMGQSTSAKGREEAHVGPDVVSRWFEGIELSYSEEPLVGVLPDCPSVLDDRYRAAGELGRLAASGKIHWRSEGSYPAYWRVCPSHLITKEDKMRVARDWSNVLFPLNSVLANPPVQ